MTKHDRHIKFPATCHPETVMLYDYWLARCGERRMPRRADIDPLDIPPRLLPGICLVDVVPDTRRYVYRLVGTGDVEVRGHDPTGKSVLEGYYGPSAVDALACYDQVAATKAPLLDAIPFVAPNGRYVTDETIFLPLSDDGASVSKILVFSYRRDGSPETHPRLGLEQ